MGDYTMQQQMIHNFITTVAHTTLIFQNFASLGKLVACQNSFPCLYPHKKCNSFWSFSAPNALPRETYSSGAS